MIIYFMNIKHLQKCIETFKVSEMIYKMLVKNQYTKKQICERINNSKQYTYSNNSYRVLKDFATNFQIEILTDSEKKTIYCTPVNGLKNYLENSIKEYDLVSESKKFTQ